MSSLTSKNETPCTCPRDSFGRVSCQEQPGTSHSYCQWERQLEELEDEGPLDLEEQLEKALDLAFPLPGVRP